MKTLKKALIKKQFFLYFFLIVSTVIVFCLIHQIQIHSALRNHQTESEKQMRQIQIALAGLAAKDERIIARYDELYQNKANSTAYYICQNDNVSAEELAVLREQINAFNIQIIDPKGTVLTDAKNSVSDYSAPEFKPLLNVFRRPDSYEPLDTFDLQDNHVRYYAAKIDTSRAVIVTMIPYLIDVSSEIYTSVSSILQNIHIGSESYFIAVSKEDHTILYHPDDTLIGGNALYAGMTDDILTDGYSGKLCINNETLYGYVQDMPGGYYIACVIPEAALSANAILIAFFTAVIYFLCTGVFVFYGSNLYLDKNHILKSTFYTRKKISFNLHMGNHLIPTAIINLIIMLVSVTFMLTLIMLSRYIISNQQSAAELKQNLANQTWLEQEMQVVYNNAYLDNCKLGAYITEHTSTEDLSISFMKEVRNLIGAEDIWYVNTAGETVASSSDSWSYRISNDPDSPDYAFHQLLDGKATEVILEAQNKELSSTIYTAFHSITADQVAGDVMSVSSEDDLSGNLHQYFGVELIDKNHQQMGAFIIEVVPVLLEMSKEYIGPEAAIKNTRIGNNGFVFTIDKETSDILYIPEEYSRIGKAYHSGSAEDYGITPEQISGDYRDYLTINHSLYLAVSFETDNTYVYVAIPHTIITQYHIRMILSFVCIASIMLMLTMFLLVFTSPKEKRTIHKLITQYNNNDTSLSDAISIDHRMNTLWAIYLYSAAVLLAILILFTDKIFPEDSLIYYILKGGWKPGVHIFALTNCIITILIAIVFTTLAHMLLSWFADALNARGQTVFRLLASSIRMLGIILAFWLCLSYLGVDTTTLKASVGILTLVVGMGAQSLINDILAGIFIIFDNQFHVGDIVTVNGTKGTVQEIGIRSTKLMSKGTVVVLSNRNISNVVNHSQNNVISVISISVSYNTSIPELEEILNQELPLISSRIPGLINPAVYRGISSFEDSAVSLEFAITTPEKNRVASEAQFRKEIFLLFEREHIEIPFPQLVLSMNKENETIERRS